MLQPQQPPSSSNNNNNNSQGTDFFSHLQGRAPPSQVHPRSFSVSASDAPGANGEDGAPEAEVRRSKSMKTPARANLTGMSSFSAAGSNLAGSPASSVASGSNYTPPAAARHPLFSHHAVAPVQPSAAAERALSPPLTVVSDPGPDDAVFMSDASRPDSPTGSTMSSGAFSPTASLFLSQYSSRAAEVPLPDSQGSRVLSYILGKVLGRGGFSTVREATNVESGEMFACKIVKRDDLSDASGSVESFEREIELWKELPQHKSLLHLIDIHRTAYATFLIMPYMSGGSLLDVLKREGGNENTARKWFPGVVDAVSALHEGFEGFEGNVLHGDLKLDNFIVDLAGAIKLGDFGMAQRITASTKKHPPNTLSPHNGLDTHGRPSNLPPHMQSRGRLVTSPHSGQRPPSRSPNRRRDTLATIEVNATPTPPCPSASLPYAPPELLGSSPVTPSLSQDIWAVGIILHALLTNRLPFNDSFDPRLQMKILRGQWEQPHNLGFEWMEVLHGCLNRDIQRRWDIRRIRESDAVVGWRQVKPRLKSRSRSRARIQTDPPHHDHRGRRGPDSPVHRQYSADSIPIPGRGRSRSAARTGSHLRGSSFGDDHHHMTPDTEATPIPRSRSATRNRMTPGGGRGRPLSHHHEGSFGHGPRFTPDRLAAELEGVAITRGRSTQRFAEDQRSPNSSSGSLVVPDTARTASRSPSAPRRPLSHEWQDGGRARSRPRSSHSGHSIPGSAAWWDAHDRENASGTSSGAHTPSRGGSRTRDSPGRPSPHVDPFIPGLPGSRPPTMGFELDVVDEDVPARGRSPSSRGRVPDRSKSRGRMQL